MATNLPLLKFLFFLFFSSLGTSHAQYIKPGDTLISSSTRPLLDSPNGRFNLDVMSVAKSNYTYLGVFLVLSNRTAQCIWHLRQGIPSANGSDEVILENKDGALRIRRQGGIPITLCSFATNKTIATLLDSGNFVFNEVYSNGSTKRVLWQSFDHLDDQLIPGIKLGVNHKTGQNWSLTSWLTSDTPIPGAFTLEWDPKGHELVIKHRGVDHWKSGVLIDNQFENISPHLTSMYDFNVVSNGDEESFSLKYKNQSLPQTWWILSPTGRLVEDSINGTVLIAGADNCYGYNTDGGCQRWNQPECRHNDGTVDFKSGVFTDIEDHFYTTPNTNLSTSDCKVRCWNNCSCVAFYSLYENATGCKFWTNMTNFIPDDSSRSERLYIITPETSNSANPNNITLKASQSGKSKWIWIGIVIAIAFVTFSCIMCYCCLLRKRKVVLQDSNQSKLLDWKKRFNIVEGIAQGLIFLHKYSRVKVIHRDLKASNILLDQSMNPKISDFGMARIFKQNEMEANTNRIVGTYGYMSPEYAMEGVFSMKSDVYSFGVLMLEIVSGRKNNSFYDDKHALNLVGYAWDLWQEGKGLELVDPTIRESCVEYQVLRCIHVGLLCVEDGAIDRPTMLDMLSMLTNESTQLPLPKKPVFSIGRKSIVANIPNKEPEVYTVNDLSITDMDPR